MFAQLRLRAALPLLTLAFAAGTRCLAQVTPQQPPARVLVAYFPQWGLYDEIPYTVKSLVASGGAAMIDQLNYAQGFVTGGHCSVADPNADLNYTFTAQTSVDGSADRTGPALRGNFHQLQELKRRNPHLRLVISLEGRASDFAADAQPDARAAFVGSCVDLFLRGNIAPGIAAPGLFDGIDVDWEYPRGADADNYLPLLKEFRRQMDELHPGLLLTVALGPSPRMYGATDVAALGRLVDRAGLMTYDFNGPWSPTTGLIAPLVSSDGGSVERSVSSWLDAGMPPRKLLVGLPFYGYGWRGVPDANHGVGQDGQPVRGDRPYRYIAGLIAAPATASHAPERAPAPATPAPAQLQHPSAAPAQPSSVAAAQAPSAPLVLYRDPVSQAPWLFNGDTFWTYEDPASIRSKAGYVDQQALGGFMIWELSEDTPAATLLSAAHDALLHPPPVASGEPELSGGSLARPKQVSTVR